MKLSVLDKLSSSEKSQLFVQCFDAMGSRQIWDELEAQFETTFTLMDLYKMGNYLYEKLSPAEQERQYYRALQDLECCTR